MLRMFRRFRRDRAKPQRPPTIAELQAESEAEFLTSNLKRNIAKIRTLFGESSDLIVREFTIGDSPSFPAAMIQIDGMVDAKFSASELLSTLMVETRLARSSLLPRTILDALHSQALAVTQVKKEQQLSRIGVALSGGDSLLLVDGEKTGLLCSTQGFKHRSVEEPQSESGVRVPREGFTEVLSINRSLIRRRVRDPRLRFEKMQIGSVTQTPVEIAYVHGIVDQALVEEVRKRLKKIDIDGVFESGYLEAMISDNPNSIFPLVRRTERPDTVAAALTEGRVAILTDGTPFTLTVPVTLPEMLHASEDYYTHWVVATFVRTFRYISYAFAMLGPAVYVALVTFHQEMIPTTLTHGVAAAREGVPFTAAIEAFFMLSVFEVLREAGIRLPRIVGSSMTIVGALVLGQQTVNAGLASPSMVVVVAGTAIASFTNPTYALDASSRILRFAYLIAGALLGLFGIFFVVCLVGMHLCSLRSFGVPYLSPFAPLNVSGLRDTAYRAPWWVLIMRPPYLTIRDEKRQDVSNRPRPE